MDIKRKANFLKEIRFFS
ncbi:hypothetical protein CGSHi22121_04850 [Haemophilus influenzae 22.1-21]|nr:hypothetical protein CGSHi22121_04850 [Haemophilus influenzae 22.1-21]